MGYITNVISYMNISQSNYSAHLSSHVTSYHASLPSWQRSSYLSVAQDIKRTTPDIIKTPVKPEIKAELNTSVNISTLVSLFPCLA